MSYAYIISLSQYMYEKQGQYIRAVLIYKVTNGPT